MIDLSIIIVNYNVKEFLLNLLESIRKASDNLSIETIVVDNASEDGSVEAIQTKFPEVILIANEKNLGFGAANNIALEKARGKYLLLLNPDTIVKEDTFRKMIDFFDKNPNAGIAGCKVLNPDGTLQLACRRSFPGPWTSFTKVMGLSSLFPKSKLFARYNLTFLDENQTYEVDAVSGAFMMLRREVYEKIGGFDPQFFMYGEDLDLCYRTQQAGYKVYYVHSTEIFHYKGESTKRSSIDETKYFYDAMHLFVKKHLSSSFIVQGILRLAIFVRKLIAFANVYKLILLSVLFDFILMSGAVYLAEKIYANEHWLGFPGYAKPWVYFIPALLQIFISAAAGAYKKNALSVLRSLIALVYGLIILSALTYFFKQFAFSRAVVLITYGFSFITFSLWRIILKVSTGLGLVSESRKARTLIVASPAKAAELASKLKSNIVSLYQVTGFISTDRKKIGDVVGGYRVIGSLDNLRKVIAEHKIEKVIFSSDEINYDQIFYAVSESQGLNVDFMVSGKELDYLVGKSSVTMLEDLPLLKINYNISSFGHRITKLIFDKILSLIFILLLIYPFIYLAEKFRKGKGSKGDFSNFVLQIPQVLKGRKSFVGPKKSSYYGDLYVGKPGLTGLWYVENINPDDEVELKSLDLFYAKNQNIWLDLEILGRTFSKMILRTE
ncbi:glycosyl transferase family 2 [Melioribacter roseus P3M-2]|uniref:Glycosyl transferase family 2 n=1 Tax=Melioribacter roseus (strain DSM 23840 / JCM 17771 / VKM B-2668 / P3M-2) TaxID=1191523 RepID=I6ZNG2_MELRP|nr:glycosyltransferase [Melioribacter roseus]AFN73539.1 glycosyl transferase family 2 [Melioribacter roseus P3M-2]